MSQLVATETPGLALSYDGLSASTHRMDMRRLGYAMVGLDHIITYGVVAVVERRMARPRERVDFELVAEAPKAGSVDILGALIAAHQGLQANLPFLIQIINDKAPDILWYWVSLVFKRLGGREKESDKHLEKILDLMGEMHDHEKLDRDRERQGILQIIDRLAPHASSVAVPVGESANVLRFRRLSDGTTTEISVPEAAAIRSKEPLEVGDETLMQLRIDGLTKHTNRGSVELPEEPGRYYPAEIRDPVFEVSPNPYISAMNGDEVIHVRVVPSYRAGELHRLYIMGFVST